MPRRPEKQHGAQEQDRGGTCLDLHLPHVVFAHAHGVVHLPRVPGGAGALEVALEAEEPGVRKAAWVTDVHPAAALCPTHQEHLNGNQGGVGEG